MIEHDQDILQFADYFANIEKTLYLCKNFKHQEYNESFSNHFRRVGSNKSDNYNGTFW